MKIEKRVLIALAFVLLLLAPTYTMSAAYERQRRRQVRVYFSLTGAESAANPLGLRPVTRRVSARSPAREALEELLDGPSITEQQKGYLPLHAQEFDIASLTIRNGTARVNFVSSRSWTGWPGDLAPGRFKEAVVLTLKQFPGVRRVVVSLNGRTNFGSEEG